MAEERSGVALGNRWLVERRLADAPIEEREHEIQQGDEVAQLDAPTQERNASAEERFGDAVMLHHRRLVRFAYVLSGDAATAEASVTEAYARLWPKFRRGRVRNEIPHLMRQIVAEVHERTRRATNQTVGRIVPADLETPWAALQYVPFEQRSALVLHLVEGLSLEETAALLDEPVGTIEFRIDTGLARVAELLITDGSRNG